MVWRALRRFLHDSTGATNIEYALIAAIVSIAGLTAMDALGISLETTYAEVGSHLIDAIN